MTSNASHYGGLEGHGPHQRGVNLARRKPQELRAAIHGATVGAAIAFEEGDPDDHAIMLARINELAEELVRRLAPKGPST